MLTKIFGKYEHQPSLNTQTTLSEIRVKELTPSNGNDCVNQKRRFASVWPKRWKFIIWCFKKWSTKYSVYMPQYQYAVLSIFIKKISKGFNLEVRNGSVLFFFIIRYVISKMYLNRTVPKICSKHTLSFIRCDKTQIWKIGRRLWNWQI